MSSNEPIEYDRIAGLEERCSELEKNLRWTTKRLLYWEMLLWHLYDFIDNETFPLNEMVNVFLKQSLIAELEVKARFTRQAKIRIVDPETGEVEWRCGGERNDYFKQQIKRMKKREIAAIVKEFKDEGGEVFGEILEQEIENMGEKG
jgi:hypothetical protein